MRERLSAGPMEQFNTKSKGLQYALLLEFLLQCRSYKHHRFVQSKYETSNKKAQSKGSLEDDIYGEINSQDLSKGSL